jgi:hypothetical protein
LIKLWLSALTLSRFRFAAIQLSFAAKEIKTNQFSHNNLIFRDNPRKINNSACFAKKFLFWLILCITPISLQDFTQGDIIGVIQTTTIIDQQTPPSEFLTRFRLCKSTHVIEEAELSLL